MRYRLYGEWEKDDERIPMVLAARQTAKVYLFIRLSSSCVLQSLVRYKCHLLFYVALQLDTRRILKRLAKENLKQLGRMVAKLAHANPMTVLRTIVHQVLFNWEYPLLVSCCSVFYNIRKVNGLKTLMCRLRHTGI